MLKRYQVKIYDLDGTYRKTLSPSIVKSLIAFSSVINGGQGQLVLDLALPSDNFGEGDYIDHMKVVRVYQVDRSNSTSPRLVYTGWISQYTPYFNGSNEGVKVTLLGLVSLLSRAYYKSGSNYTFTKTTTDPADIIKDIIDHFNTVYTGGWLSYSGGHIDDVGTNVTYEYDELTWLDAINATHELADGDWWWHIGADGQVYFKNKPSSATHLLAKGKAVHEAEIKKTNEDVVNKVVLSYNGGTGTYTDATSQTAHGLREKLIDDQKITNSTTSDQKGNKEVDDNKNPKVEGRLTLNAANFDLESVKVGDTVSVTNFKKGQNPFTSNLQVTGLRYQPEFMVVELEAAKSRFQKRMEETVKNITT